MPGLAWLGVATATLAFMAKCCRNPSVSTLGINRVMEMFDGITNFFKQFFYPLLKLTDLSCFPISVGKFYNFGLPDFPDNINLSGQIGLILIVMNK